MYSTESLHSAVVEVIVKRNATVSLHHHSELGQQHLQPGHEAGEWLTEDATMEWVDGNLGSQLTMKYPAVYMMEPGARGEILSIAFASTRAAPGCGRQAGALPRPHTTGQIISTINLQRTAVEAATVAW